MLRIRFSDADLVRIRVLAEPNPLWEVLLSLHRLREPRRDQVPDRWGRTVPEKARWAVAMLHQLARHKGYSPDFLTPEAEIADLDAGLDLVLRTPREVLRTDLARLGAEHPVSGWVRDLAEGDPPALRLLGEALTTYHDTAIAPFWPTIRRLARADHERRAALAMERGLEAVLGALHVSARWNPPLLEIAYPVEQEVVLGGRGLTLVPSYFCHPGPIMLLRQPERPFLVYSVETPETGADLLEAEGRNRGLASLLGRTRAEVLRLLGAERPLSTTELAKAAGISLAGASQHASILREAGLVVTERRGGSVLHRASRKGAALL